MAVFSGGSAPMEYFICVIGMVMIIEGIPYFMGPGKMKFWAQKLQELPDGTLRIFGGALMAVGLILVYYGRS